MPAAPHVRFLSYCGKSRRSAGAVCRGYRDEKTSFAQILYFRGEVEKASLSLRDIHADALDFDARVGLEMMRALCALHQGDIAAWQDVKQQMKAMLDHCADQREQLLFWTASIDSMIDDATAFPQWFKKGELNILPSFLMAFF